MVTVALSEHRLLERGALATWIGLHAASYLLLLMGLQTDMAAAYREGRSGSALHLLARLAILAAVYALLRASDPGFLPLRSASVEAGPGTCSACHCQLSKGVKHCRYCDRCVEGWSHHCVWIGVCVGRRNHLLFWAFLALQTYVAAVGVDAALSACHSRGGPRQLLAASATVGFFMIVLLFAFALLVFHSALLLTGTTTHAAFGASSRNNSAAHRSSSGDSSDELYSKKPAGALLGCVHGLLWCACGADAQTLAAASRAVEQGQRRIARLLDNSYYSCC